MATTYEEYRKQFVGKKPKPGEVLSRSQFETQQTGTSPTKAVTTSGEVAGGGAGVDAGTKPFQTTVQKEEQLRGELGLETTPLDPLSPEYLEDFKSQQDLAKTRLERKVSEARQADEFALGETKRQAQESIAATGAQMAESREGLQTSARPAGAAKFASVTNARVSQATNRFRAAEAARQDALQQMERARKEQNTSLVKSLQSRLDQIETEKAEAEAALLDARDKAAQTALDVQSQAQQSLMDLIDTIGLDNLASIDTGALIGLASNAATGAGLTDETQVARVAQSALAFKQLSQSLKDAKTPEERSGILGLAQRIGEAGVVGEIQKATILTEARRRIGMPKEDGGITQEEFDQFKNIISPDEGDTLSELDRLKIEDKMLDIEIKRRGASLESGGRISTSNIGNGTVTQNYGDRSPINDNVKLQSGEVGTPGIDIDGKIGDPVYAFKGGTVVAVGTHPDYGKYVHVEDDQGNLHQYNHLSAFGVSDGDTISEGSALGAMGNTGSVVPGESGDGSHLDYRVKSKLPVNGSYWVDPSRFIYDPTFDGMQALKFNNVRKNLPTRFVDSEEDRKALQETVAMFPELTSNGIMKRFVIGEDYDQLDAPTKNVADAVFNVLRTVTDESVDNGPIIAAIKDGQFISGINTAEGAKLKNIDSKYQPGSVESRIRLIENAKKIADKNRGALGKVNAWTFKGLRAVGVNSADAQRLATVFSFLNAEERRELAGTAVTDSELAAIDDIMFNITDPEENAFAKLETVSQLLIDSYNQNRLSQGLVLLDIQDILSPENKVSLYKAGTTLQSQLNEGADSYLNNVVSEIGGSDLDAQINEYLDSLNPKNDG